MRVLMITPRIPWPKDSGWSVAVNATLDALVRGGAAVDLFAIDTSRHPGDITGLETRCGTVLAFALDTQIRRTQGIARTVFPTRTDRFGIDGRAPYWVSRFASMEVGERMADAASAFGPYDCVVIEYLFALPVGLRVADRLQQEFGRRPRVVLRAHNVESVLQQRLADELGLASPERWIRAITAKQTTRWERAALDAVDAVACITDADRDLFHAMGVRAELRTILPGIPTVPPAETVMEPRVGFIGLLDYAVNLASLEWFLERIWPLVRIEVPNATFHIAGHGGSVPERWAQTAGVEFHGRVADATTFEQSNRVMVVPTLAASGLRIKLLEAMAAGVPVVTTTAGAEGTPITSGEQAFVANDAADFARACVTLLTDSALAASVAERGRHFVAELSDEGSATRAWLEILTDAAVVS